MAASDKPTNVHSLEEARAQVRASQLTDKLARTPKGAILPSVSNLVLILSGDRVLSGLCAFNEFRCAAVLTRAPPKMDDENDGVPGPYDRLWTAPDVTMVQFYIQRTYTQAAKANDVEAAMHAVAGATRFHPPRDWIDGLVWDGVARLNTWLVKAFGAPKDDKYHRAVGVAFLIAAVRRLRCPGSKFDHMPILEGDQGIGKSRSVRALFGELWFTDSLPHALGTTDAALGLQGIWAVEFAEIEQIIRNEVEVIKAFLSRSVDRFRAPYHKGFQDYPRQSVLIGTTNESDYLRDASGNRRFWPIKCSRADVEWIIANREQLWAEASKREAEGEVHWLTDVVTIGEAQASQKARMQEDAWEDKILAFVDSLTFGPEDNPKKKDWTTSADVMSDCLSIPIERQDRKAQMRVAAVLKRAGWANPLEWDADQRKMMRRWRKVQDV